MDGKNQQTTGAVGLAGNRVIDYAFPYKERKRLSIFYFAPALPNWLIHVGIQQEREQVLLTIPAIGYIMSPVL